MRLYARRFGCVCLFELLIGEIGGVDWIPHSGVFILIERPLAYELYSSIRFVIIGLSELIHFAKYRFFRSRILSSSFNSSARRRSGSFPNSFFFLKIALRELFWITLSLVCAPAWRQSPMANEYSIFELLFLFLSSCLVNSYFSIYRLPINQLIFSTHILRAHIYFIFSTDKQN